MDGERLHCHSRANVQANMVPFFEEIESLEKNGVLYDPMDDKLLGVWDKFKDESPEERARNNLSQVNLTFWHGADMAAQCAVLGHGCAGKEYCGHCMAHRDERHIPYELYKVETAINFQKLANQYDMFSETLYAINAAEDFKKVQKLTEDGLRASTKSSMLPEEIAEPRGGPAK